MGQLIDFQEYKERKAVEAIEFVPPRHEGYCPFCQAPTLIKRTAGGTQVHTFDPENMEAYRKLKKLMITIVEYFKNQEDGVQDDDLVAAFGEGMEEFLKELEQEKE
jgi:hypothetical protein